MAKKSITLGDKTFDRMSDAKDFVKSILNSVHLEYGEEKTLPEEFFSVIRDVLGRHPRIQDKIKDFPSSLKSIFIRKSIYGKNEFCYVLSDGFTKTFSYLKCLGSQKINHRADVTQIFRHLIHDQISDFKKANLHGEYGTCCISQIRFPSEYLVVDHYIPFSSLVRSFMSEYGLKYDDIEISYNDGDENKEKVLKDGKIADAFREYHRKNAVLCMMHKDLNSQLRDKKKTKKELEAILWSFNEKHNVGDMLMAKFLNRLFSSNDGQA